MSWLWLRWILYHFKRQCLSLAKVKHCRTPLQWQGSNCSPWTALCEYQSYCFTYILLRKHSYGEELFPLEKHFNCFIWNSWFSGGLLIQWIMITVINFDLSCIFLFFVYFYILYYLRAKLNLRGYRLWLKAWKPQTLDHTGEGLIPAQRGSLWI